MRLASRKIAMSSNEPHSNLKQSPVAAFRLGAGAAECIEKIKGLPNGRLLSLSSLGIRGLGLSGSLLSKNRARSTLGASKHKCF